MIDFKIRGIKEINDAVRRIPRGAARVFLRAIAEYIIGNGQHGLKRYPVYKYITRRQAYGKPFVSDKQRRFVMARIREGRIDPGVPHRTGRTQRGYVMVEKQRGYQISIINKERGAVYTRHDQLQARLNALAGWKKRAQVVINNLGGAFRHAHAEVRKHLAKRRK